MTWTSSNSIQIPELQLTCINVIPIDYLTRQNQNVLNFSCAAWNNRLIRHLKKFNIISTYTVYPLARSLNIETPSNVILSLHKLHGQQISCCYRLLLLLSNNYKLSRVLSHIIVPLHICTSHLSIMYYSWLVLSYLGLLRKLFLEPSINLDFKCGVDISLEHHQLLKKNTFYFSIWYMMFYYTKDIDIHFQLDSYL